MAEENRAETGARPAVELGVEGIGNGIDEILEQSVGARPELEGQGVATPQEINAVVMEVMAMNKTPITQQNFTKVYVSICHMVQIGATSPKFSETRKITDYGVEVKVGDVRTACKKIGITVRKLARGLKNDVIKVAAKHNLAGNLAKNYKLENPNYEVQDLIWVSDFQTFSENLAMPEHVKEWLLANYKKRFRTSQ